MYSSTSTAPYQTSSSTSDKFPQDKWLSRSVAFKIIHY